MFDIESTLGGTHSRYDMFIMRKKFTYVYVIIMMGGRNVASHIQKKKQLPRHTIFRSIFCNI